MAERRPEGPYVSLILPNRNNDRVIDLFFEKLAAHTTGPAYELVVVDDGSTDRSLDKLRRWRESGRFATFTLVEKPWSGIVDTLNAALAHARGEVIVRLDGDATLESPGWLETMLRLLESDPRVGVVTGRTVFDNGRVHSYGFNVVCPEGIHDRGTTITEPPGQRTLDLNVERPLDSESPLAGVPAEVDSAGGCCMMFRAADAAAVGGFDTRYSPVWVEDFDFALGIRRLGKKVFFVPDVLVIHRVGLRNPRHQATRRERALYAARHRIGHLVPERLRAAAAAAGRIGHHDPRHQEQLRKHYASWERKWGWDPLNPRLDDILERYADTEICWAYDDERRAAGEAILRAVREPA
jgi:GT2 family glycosyltransferase